LLEASVRGEDHVGQAGLRVDEFNVGNCGEFAIEMTPLLQCVTARGSMDIARHPRIDDVVDVIEGGRTHQVRGPSRR